MYSPFGSTRIQIAVCVGLVAVVATGLGISSHSPARAASGASPHQLVTTTTENNEKTSTSVEPVTTAAPADPSGFIDNVKAFYGAYTKLPDNTGTKELIAKYVAAPYGSTLNGTSVDYDQVMCAQNFPASFTVGTPTVKGDEVTVTVNEKWVYDVGTVNVTGSANSGLITHIACVGLD